MLEQVNSSTTLGWVVKFSLSMIKWKMNVIPSWQNKVKSSICNHKIAKISLSFHDLEISILLLDLVQQSSSLTLNLESRSSNPFICNCFGISYLCINLFLCGVWVFFFVRACVRVGGYFDEIGLPYLASHPFCSLKKKRWDLHYKIDMVDILYCYISL